MIVNFVTSSICQFSYQTEIQSFTPIKQAEVSIPFSKSQIFSLIDYIRCLREKDKMADKIKPINNKLMNNILILGAGRSATSLINYVLDQMSGSVLGLFFS